MTTKSCAGGGTAGFPVSQQSSLEPKIEELNERIRLLEEERSCLLDSCSELRASQDVLLEAIGAANQEQVQAEMLSMELE